MFYGEGDIDSGQWNSWTDKSFKNDDVKRIQTGNYHEIELVIRTNEKIDFPSDIIVQQLSQNVYKLKINKIMKFNLPKCEILHFTAKQISDKEYFIPCDLNEEININGEKYKMKNILWIIISLIIFAFIFSFLCRYFIKRYNKNGFYNNFLINP